MRLATSLFACVVLVCTASAAYGQTYWHSDGQGYSTRIGNTVFNNRNFGHGTSSTHTRVGNHQFHQFNNGTQGSTYYGPTGRYDNFSNPQQGWYGNGFSPYQGQFGNPYGGYRRYSY